MRRFMIWEPTLAAPDKRTLIDTVAVYLAQHGLIPLERCRGLAEALMEREDLGDTLAAENMAIPHAACPDAGEGVFLFVKLARPLADWSAGAQVDRFVFTVLPPEPSEEDGEAVKRFFTALADDDVIGVYSRGDRDEVASNFL
ncbi:PTS sugar transporter subunit IIA [Bifidobacterium saguinibicoloris]|uniref:PTS sugar transporter subunit IIA n=1 Tax=Bifidobacterium saguinibicoloris TaxID=2834433 RepID=UPI001C567015|nr:PTS sugar transporter subunit IIA [Bifidobacterium saguinibicoloris]MBW3080405.1 PTS sugar transporter subunit IIA [Bifidobacterium saguinibicoloris]